MLAIITSASTLYASAEPWVISGKVISVSDGDTLMLLLKDSSKVSIRLSDIDAPERSHGEKRPGQPYSRVSTQSLKALAQGEFAKATCYEIDNPKFKRPVCTVFVNGINVNAEQVLQGMAWANRASPRYVRDPQIYVLEQRARINSRGIWGKTGSNVIEPWIWRDRCWRQNVCSADQ